MEHIKELNDLYLRGKDELALYEESKSDICAFKTDLDSSSLDEEKISWLSNKISLLMDCSNAPENLICLKNLIDCYQKYTKTIDEYEGMLVAFSVDQSTRKELNTCSTTLLNARDSFSHSKTICLNSFGVSISTPQVFCDVFISVIEECITKTKKTIHSIFIILVSVFPQNIY